MEPHTYFTHIVMAFPAFVSAADNWFYLNSQKYFQLYEKSKKQIQKTPSASGSLPKQNNYNKVLMSCFANECIRLWQRKRHNMRTD